MKKPKQNDIEEIELFSSEEYKDIIQICSILKDNNIPYVKRRFNPIFYFKTYHYTTTKIYVSNEDYEKASKLILGYVPYKNTNNQIKDDVYTPKVNKFRKYSIIYFYRNPCYILYLRFSNKSN